MSKKLLREFISDSVLEFNGKFKIIFELLNLHFAFIPFDLKLVIFPNPQEISTNSLCPVELLKRRAIFERVRVTLYIELD